MNASDDPLPFRLLRPEWHDSLPSTSANLRERLAGDPALPSGTVVAARRQTAGRGRAGKRWTSSPEGGDLMFSFLWRGRADLEKLASLPMACALAVAGFLEDLGIPAGVKWPNDVLADGAKICGVLTERPALPDSGAGRDVAIVGIGVNVNMARDVAAGIGRPATSVFLLTGAERDAEEALSLLAPFLERRISRWQAGGFASLREDWVAARRNAGIP